MNSIKSKTLYEDVLLHNICVCTSSDHTLHWRYSPSPEFWNGYDDAVYVDTYLSDYPYFWKRLWYGIKYIFGYKSRYGAFDNFILSKEEAQKLSDFLQNTYLKKPPMSINDIAGDSQID